MIFYRPQFSKWLEERTLPNGQLIGPKWVLFPRRTDRIASRYPDSTVIHPKRYAAIEAEYAALFGPPHDDQQADLILALRLARDHVAEAYPGSFALTQIDAVLQQHA